MAMICLHFYMNGELALDLAAKWKTKTQYQVKQV